MDSATITFAVDEELKSAFEEAARASNTHSDELLRHLMRNYVEESGPNADYDAWVIRQVEEGLQDAEAGRVLSSETVEEHFASWRKETLRKSRSSR